MDKTNSTRLFVILARGASEGVIFRRGPSKRVLLIKWYLGSDRLEYGQWFKGRIYERRCDLSPSGDLLLYFAAKYKAPYRAWTAISKPPFLTALALWPKNDGWGGGGVFDRELSIQLNHCRGEDVLAEGFKLKKKMNMKLLGMHSGSGEDFPIYNTLLLRNGWNLLTTGKLDKANRNAKIVWEYFKPIIYEKFSKEGYSLQMLIRGINQKDDAWYWIDYLIFDKKGKQFFTLPKTDWADWDSEGDLLLAKDGKLYRLNKKNFNQYPSSGDKALKLIADFNALKFEEKKAPNEASIW